MSKDMQAPALLQAMIRYLDCPCTYFAPTLDDNEIVTAYHKAAERGKTEGFVPILVTEDDTLWECLTMHTEENRGENAFNPEVVVAYRKKMLETVLPEGEAAAEAVINYRRENLAEYGLNWDEMPLGDMNNGETLDRFLAYWDYSSRCTSPLILAEIPVKNPWEVFAYLPFGGWNECPDTPELMAMSKYWFELHGAVPAVITHDTLEYVLPAPVKQELALKVALEQYAWCPDIVEQAGEDASVGSLADGLTTSTNWYFWWD